MISAGQRGLGLRAAHVTELRAQPLGNTWLEAITEAVLDEASVARAHLRALRASYDVTLHGVTMGLGNTTRPDAAYLLALRQLIDDVTPAIVSDHLCWGAVGQHLSHELLPLPLTSWAAAWVADQIAYVQDTLGRRIAIENISSYAALTASTMPEWEFVSAVVSRSQCELLLDINNIAVAAHNHGFSPTAYIDAMRGLPIVELHLAGYVTRASHKGTFRLDTHSEPVADDVWDLYRYATTVLGPRPTLIEWDSDLPPLARLLGEADAALAQQAAAVATVSSTSTRPSSSRAYSAHVSSSSRAQPTRFAAAASSHHEVPHA